MYLLTRKHGGKVEKVTPCQTIADIHKAVHSTVRPSIKAGTRYLELYGDKTVHLGTVGITAYYLELKGASYGNIQYGNNHAEG